MTDPAAKAAPKKGRQSGAKAPKAAPKSTPISDMPPEVIADGLQPQPEQQVPNAVIVHRYRKEDGSIEVQVGVLGDMTVDAAQSVLELGVKHVRQTLGLKD